MGSESALVSKEGFFRAGSQSDPRIPSKKAVTEAHVQRSVRGKSRKTFVKFLMKGLILVGGLGTQVCASHVFALERTCSALRQP